MEAERAADFRESACDVIKSLAVAICCILLGIALMWNHDPRDGPCAQQWCELKDLCDIPVGCTKALYVVDRPQSITKSCDWSSLNTLVVLGSSNVKFEVGGHRLPRGRFMMTGVEFDNVIGYKDLFIANDKLTTFYLTDSDFYTDTHDPTDNTQKPLCDLDKRDRTLELAHGRDPPVKESGIIPGLRFVSSDTNEWLPYEVGASIVRADTKEPKLVVVNHIEWKDLADNDATDDLQSESPPEQP